MSTIANDARHFDDHLGMHIHRRSLRSRATACRFVAASSWRSWPIKALVVRERVDDLKFKIRNVETDHSIEVVGWTRHSEGCWPQPVVTGAGGAERSLTIHRSARHERAME